MSDNQNAGDAPIIDDSISAQDTGMGGDADLPLISEEGSPVSKEAAPAQNDLKEQLEEAVEEGASEEEIKQIIKEYKIKVNGKEKTVKLDLSNDEEVKRYLQLAGAGQSAMQRTKELEREYQDGIKRLLADPMSVLQELGINPEDVSTKYLEAKIAEMKKSPEQVEREKLQKELESARAELQRQRDDAEQAKFEQLQSQESGKLEKEIMEALDGHKSLPKSQRTISRIADAMLWAMEKGFEGVTVKDVLPTVEEEVRREMSRFADELPDDLLEEYLGRKTFDRYRKKRLAAKKVEAPLNEVRSVSKEAPKEDSGQKKRLKAADYFRNLG